MINFPFLYWMTYLSSDYFSNQISTYQDLHYIMKVIINLKQHQLCEIILLIAQTNELFSRLHFHSNDLLQHGDSLDNFLEIAQANAYSLSFLLKLKFNHSNGLISAREAVTFRIPKY